MSLTVLAAMAVAQVRPGPPTPRPPAKKVFHTGKTHPFEAPHFANAKAKSVTYAMLKAESHLGPMRIQIKGDGGNAKIAWNAGRLRQDGSGGSWVYRSGILSVSCHKGFFRGKATRADVLDYVTALTGGADTFARQLLLRQRPFEDFFAAHETARIAGEITLGASSDILKLDSKALGATLMVRRSDHLVLSADADSLAPNGTVLYHAHRTYTYLPLSNPGVFTLSPKRGAKVKPLPKSAIKIGEHLVG